MGKIKGYTTARKTGQCSQCGGVVLKGMVLRLWGRGWSHLNCEDPWRSLRKRGSVRQARVEKSQNLPTPGDVPWWSARMPSGQPRVAPSPDDVEAGKTPAGGWSKKQLAAWGVPWPPPTGWRRELERIYWRQRGQEAEGSRTVDGRPVRTSDTTPTAGGYLESKLAELRSRPPGNS